jgi:ATP-dependent helicase/nuclease subunit B
MHKIQTPSTPHHAPLKQIAEHLFQMCQGEPLQMAEAIIFLPSRRAKRHFIEELQNFSSTETFILPQVSTLKDWGLRADSFSLRLPPPVSFFERELHYIHLLKPYVREEAQAAHFAESLAALHDEFILAEVPLEKVNYLAPEAFAVHWQESLRYLEVIKDQWPNFLRKIGRSDPCIYFLHMLNAQIEAWKQNPLKTPVIAAGLESGIPVITKLIEMIGQLPKGRVYQENHENRLEKKTIINLLSCKSQPFQDANQEEGFEADLLTQKLYLGEFSSLEEEARVIAILMRERLEDENKSIALVTPSRSLAQRVTLELARWNLNVDDSYGKSLLDIPFGIFLRQSLKCILRDFESIPLLSLLKHPCTSQSYKMHSGKLEIQHLRGKLFISNIFTLLKEIPKGTELYNILISLQTGAAPLKYLLSQKTVILKDLIAAHLQFIEILAQNTLEQHRGYKEFTEQLQGLDEALNSLKIKGTDYLLILERLLSQVTLRPLYGTHPRLHIWGLLEAQLQTVDCMIIGGMNEKNWPGHYNQSAWLNESMRNTLNLQTRAAWYELKKRLWVNLLKAPEIILTRALREEGQLEAASRWWLALLAKLKAKGCYEKHQLNFNYQQWAKFLDYPKERNILSQPSPCPPLEARPRTLSVTQIETWIRDPYSIYAREILNLKSLAPLEPALSPALFGVMVHQILEAFFKQGYAVHDPHAYDALYNLGKSTFGESLNHPVVSSFWWTRFNRLIKWFLEIEGASMPAKRFVEVRGEILLEGPHGAFKLKATADRIDINADGETCIIDYKTGSLPSRKEIEQGVMPQLPLEGAILQNGGFQGMSSHAAISMRYMHLSGGQPAGAILDISGGELIVQALENLQNMIIQYDNPSKPYLSCPDPKIAPVFSPYHHLSRIQEWQRM